MPTGPGTERTPYVVRVRYRWRDHPTRTWDLTSRRRLCDALEYVEQVRTSWLRLVGGQATPLSWYVVDIRDFAEYRPGIATSFGETDGKDENGRNYARRDSGGGMGAPGVRGRRLQPRRGSRTGHSGR